MDIAEGVNVVGYCASGCAARLQRKLVEKLHLERPRRSPLRPRSPRVLPDDTTPVDHRTLAGSIWEEAGHGQIMRRRKIFPLAVRMDE